MKIKKYIANDMQEALIRIKTELGKDALILSTRKIKQKGFLGFLKPPLLEVTAAFDDEKKVNIETEKPATTTRTNDVMDIQKIEKKIEELERLIKGITNEINWIPEKKEFGKRSFLETVKENLLKNGVEDEVLNDIFNNVTFDGSINGIINTLFKGIKDMLGEGEPFIIEASKKPYVVFFVGPTGVGKTTTIAKIAAKLIFEHNKNVSLVTADTYRIAAVEQLKTYAEIMGIKLKVWYDLNEYQSIIEDLKDSDFILVDTAGRNHRNYEHMNELRGFIETAKPDEIFLLLSATTNFKTSKYIINNYTFLDNFKLIITKVDECETYGNILNIKHYAQKPISYITTGQNVPDDIQEFVSDKFAKLIIGSQSV